MNVELIANHITDRFVPFGLAVLISLLVLVLAINMNKNRDNCKKSFAKFLEDFARDNLTRKREATEFARSFSGWTAKKLANANVSKVEEVLDCCLPQNRDKNGKLARKLIDKTSIEQGILDADIIIGTSPTTLPIDICRSLIASELAYSRTPSAVEEYSAVHHDICVVSKRSHGGEQGQYAKFIIADTQLKHQGQKPSNEPLIVAFTGTELKTEEDDYILDDALADMNILAADIAEGQVHHGFATRANSFNIEWLKKEIEVNRRRVLITGHSLGGATASLVTLRLLKNLPSKEHRRKVHCITFAAPLYGDKTLAKYLRHEDVDWERHFTHVVNLNDPVPFLLSRVDAVKNSVEMRKLLHWARSVLEDKIGPIAGKVINVAIDCLTTPNYQPVGRFLEFSAKDGSSMNATLNKNKINNSCSIHGNEESNWWEQVSKKLFDRITSKNAVSFVKNAYCQHACRVYGAWISRAFSAHEPEGELPVITYQNAKTIREMKIGEPFIDKPTVSVDNHGILTASFKPERPEFIRSFTLQMSCGDKTIKFRRNNIGFKFHSREDVDTTLPSQENTTATFTAAIEHAFVGKYTKSWEHIPIQLRKPGVAHRQRIENMTSDRFFETALFAATFENDETIAKLGEVAASINLPEMGSDIISVRDELKNIWQSAANEVGEKQEEIDKIFTNCSEKLSKVWDEHVKPSSFYEQMVAYAGGSSRVAKTSFAWLYAAGVAAADVYAAVPVVTIASILILAEIGKTIKGGDSNLLQPTDLLKRNKKKGKTSYDELLKSDHAIERLVGHFGNILVASHLIAVLGHTNAGKSALIELLVPGCDIKVGRSPGCSTLTVSKYHLPLCNLVSMLDFPGMNDDTVNCKFFSKLHGLAMTKIVLAKLEDVKAEHTKKLRSLLKEDEKGTVIYLTNADLFAEGLTKKQWDVEYKRAVDDLKEKVGVFHRKVKVYPACFGDPKNKEIFDWGVCDVDHVRLHIVAACIESGTGERVERILHDRLAPNVMPYANFAEYRYPKAPHDIMREFQESQSCSRQETSNSKSRSDACTILSIALFGSNRYSQDLREVARANLDNRVDYLNPYMDLLKAHRKCENEQQVIKVLISTERDTNEMHILAIAHALHLQVLLVYNNAHQRLFGPASSNLHFVIHVDCDGFKVCDSQ